MANPSTAWQPANEPTKKKSCDARPAGYIDHGACRKKKISSAENQRPYARTLPPAPEDPAVTSPALAVRRRARPRQTPPQPLKNAGLHVVLHHRAWTTSARPTSDLRRPQTQRCAALIQPHPIQTCHQIELRPGCHTVKKHPIQAVKSYTHSENKYEQMPPSPLLSA